LSDNEAKNLLPSTPINTFENQFYDNGDGSYLLNGATEHGYFMNIVQTEEPEIYLEKGATYVLDLGCVTNVVKAQITLGDARGNWGDPMPTDATGKLTFTVGEANRIVVVSICAESGMVVKNLLIRPSLHKVTSSGTQDYSKVKLYRYGFNESDNKITLTPKADGTVDVPSISPYMTLQTDKGNIRISATYNIDTKTYVDKNNGNGGGNGENGATFMPSVSADGVISWTNDKGLANPTPVNIKGEQGERGLQGVQGDKGDAYTLTENDKNTIANAVKSSLSTEIWTFKLEDGTTVEKVVLLG
jgi:hypothetical protein